MRTTIPEHPSHFHTHAHTHACASLPHLMLTCIWNRYGEEGDPNREIYLGCRNNQSENYFMRVVLYSLGYRASLEQCMHTHTWHSRNRQYLSPVIVSSVAPSRCSTFTLSFSNTPTHIYTITYEPSNKNTQNTNLNLMLTYPPYTHNSCGYICSPPLI